MEGVRADRGGLVCTGGPLRWILARIVDSDRHAISRIH